MRYDRTPYHKRLAARLAASKEKHNRERDNRYMQIDKFLCCFEQAWKEYYQQDIIITYKHGWYYLHKRKFRHSELEVQLLLLLAKLHELESATGEENGNFY